MDWEKVKEFLAVLTGSFLVFGFFALYENYGQAIYAGSFFFVLYYIKDEFVSNFKTHENPTLGSKLGNVTSLALMLGIGVGLLTILIVGVTNLDYCEGWAKSEQYCAIQQVKERYDSGDYSEDY